MASKCKYRAWDKLDKVMLDVTAINFVDSKGVIHPEVLTIKYKENGKFYECIPQFVELMQSTGLNDMEGNEIFIGDILLWSNDVIILIKEKDELGFYDETIKSFDENIVYHDIRFYRSEDEAVILGNIFENPRMKNKTNWTKGKIKGLKE